MDHLSGLASVEVSAQRTIGGISFKVVGHVPKGGAHMSAYIDHKLIKVLAGNMMPEREFSDSSKTVYSQF